jgi:hypothetical protein
MVSAGTLHVVSTELAVGSFAMAGLAFLLAGLASHGWLNMGRHLNLADHVAHFALAFGLVAMPFAIITGIQSSPGTGVDHPILINKMFLSSSAFGLAFGVLLTRRKYGQEVWTRFWGRRWQTMGGMAAVAMVLVTASMGGTFSRGESLLDVFSLPYEEVPLMPMWLSGLVMAVAVANMVMMRQRTT